MDAGDPGSLSRLRRAAPASRFCPYLSLLLRQLKGRIRPVFAAATDSPSGELRRRTGLRTLEFTCTLDRVAVVDLGSGASCSVIVGGTVSGGSRRLS